MSETLMRKFDLQVDQLSFEYVNKCINIKTLERIVRVLRSGEEGHYPELQLRAEQRLAEMSPTNKLIRPEEPLTFRGDIPENVWEELESDLLDWEKEMKTHDKIFKNIKDHSATSLPEIRTFETSQRDSEAQRESSIAKSVDARKINRDDYESWNKFDPDEEILKIEIAQERKEEELKKSKLVQEKKEIAMANLSDSVPCEDLPIEVRRLEAQKAREKGNECFKAGDWNLALSFYNQSISYDKTCLACNNRAMTYIKLKNFEAGINDCNFVLDQEPDNVKALSRRATCYKESALQSDLQSALEDLEKVLQLEPNNKTAQSDYQQIRKKLKLADEPVKVRLEIEESSTSHLSEEERSESAESAREKGNGYFKAKDYKNALDCYTESLSFKKTPSAANNRALTYINLGQYKEALSDCNLVLKLEPSNIKALIRRAACYRESNSEADWKKALEDLEKVLKLEPTNSVAKSDYQVIRRKLKLPDVQPKVRLKIENASTSTSNKKPPLIYYWPSTSSCPVMQVLYPQYGSSMSSLPYVDITCRCQRRSYRDNPLCPHCGERVLENARKRSSSVKWDPSMSAREYVRIFNERKTNLYVSPPKKVRRSISTSSQQSAASSPLPVSSTSPILKDLKATPDVHRIVPGGTSQPGGTEKAATPSTSPNRNDLRTKVPRRSEVQTSPTASPKSSATQVKLPHLVNGGGPGTREMKVAEEAKRRGDEFFKTGDFQRALICYTTSLNLHEDPDTRKSRAHTYAALGRHKEAMTDVYPTIYEPTDKKSSDVLHKLARKDDIGEILASWLQGSKYSDVGQAMKKSLEPDERGQLDPSGFISVLNAVTAANNAEKSTEEEKMTKTEKNAKKKKKKKTSTAEAASEEKEPEAQASTSNAALPTPEVQNIGNVSVTNDDEEITQEEATKSKKKKKKKKKKRASAENNNIGETASSQNQENTAPLLNGMPNNSAAPHVQNGVSLKKPTLKSVKEETNIKNQTEKLSSNAIKENNSKEEANKKNQAKPSSSQAKQEIKLDGMESEKSMPKSQEPEVKLKHGVKEKLNIEEKERVTPKLNNHESQEKSTRLKQEVNPKSKADNDSISKIAQNEPVKTKSQVDQQKESGKKSQPLSTAHTEISLDENQNGIGRKTAALDEPKLGKSRTENLEKSNIINQTAHSAINLDEKQNENGKSAALKRTENLEQSISTKPIAHTAINLDEKQKENARKSAAHKELKIDESRTEKLQGNEAKLVAKDLEKLEKVHEKTMENGIPSSENSSVHEKTKLNENGNPSLEKTKLVENGEKSHEKPKLKENGENSHEEPKLEEIEEKSRNQIKLDANEEKTHGNPKLDENGEKSHGEPKLKENRDPCHEKVKLDENKVMPHEKSVRDELKLENGHELSNGLDSNRLEEVLSSASVPSHFNFYTLWEASKDDKDYVHRLDILALTAPTSLPNVIGEKLDAKMLIDVVCCLELMVADQPYLAAQFVNVLPRLPRYQLVKLFLDPPELSRLKGLVKELEKKDVTIHSDVRDALLN